MGDNPYSDQVDEGYSYSPSTFSFMPGEQQGMQAMGLPVGESQQAQGPSDYLDAIGRYLSNAIPMKGTIQTSTPAATGLADFVRKVWPSLGKTADALPETRMSYDPNLMERGKKLGANAWYNDAAKEINIPSNTWNTTEPKTAGDALTSYLHELFHAIYKNKTGDVMPPLSTLEQGGSMLEGLPASRMRDYGVNPFYRNAPGTSEGARHSIIDGMVKNMLMKKLYNPEAVIPPRLFGP